MFELNGVELTSQDIKNYAQENNMSFTEGYEFLLSKGLKEKSVESSVGLMENLFPQIDPVEEIEDVSSVKDAGVWAMTGIVDAMDDLGNIFTGSVQRAKLLDPINRIKKGTATDEDIQKVLEFNKNPNIGMTDEILKQDFERELIAEKYGKPAAFFMTFFKEGTAQKFLQSTFLQVGALLTERGRAQAAKGAGIGATSAASLNLVPGLAFLPEEIASIPIMSLSGGYAGISQALEVQLTLSELITEELLEKGINANDATVEDVRAIMEDEEVFSDIRKRAVRRGNTIGTIDGFTGLFLKGAIRKGRGVTKRGIPTRSRTSGYLAGSAFETGMGLTSELAGQIAGEQDLDITAILEEGFIDKTMAPVSLAYNLYKGPATYSINGKEGDSGKMSAKEFFEYVNSLSDTELYEQMPLFKIENDKLASNILAQRVYDVAVDMEVDTRINDPKKRAEAIKLQKELNKIKDKKGATYDKRRSKLKEKINAIADEFADNEVDVTKEQQNEAIKLSRKDNVKKLIKSESEKLKEMGKDLGGLDLESYDTEQEMVDAFVAAGGNINEITRDADGKVTQEALILGEKMFINIDRAAAIESINPASHEVLHRIIGNSFANLDEATRLKVAGGFFNTMTKSQRKFVTQRLKDDYNVDTVDDGFFKTDKAEEIFTVFAQGIRDNEITFDEGLFSKLGLILQEFLRKSPIFKGKFKGEFTNGKQVYNFLKQYNQDIETGKFSERVKDFAAVDRADETKTAASNRQISDEAKKIQAEVDALGKKADGSKMTKAEYDAGPNIKAYEELISKGKLRTLIKNQLVKQGIDIQAEDANVNGIPLQEFLEDVESRLTTEILNFNPDKETTTQGKFGLSGFINQRIIFRTGDVAKTGKKRVDTKSLDKEQESAGGKSMADNIQDKEDSGLQDLETEDLSAQAQQDKKIKEDKGEAGIFSKLRKRLTLKGQPILGERTNSESIVNTILVEVRRIFVSERTPLSSDKFLANLEKSLDARLFKLIKNALGIKKAYDDFIIENASEIANLPTKHLVALEREVKDDADRMFTEFDKKLTSKEDVQRAVDQGLLDKEALTKIDKGQAVNLYRKKNNINLDNVVKFFDAPPINPKTGKRSGLKGTRKDTLARRFAFELAQDALPEIARMPEVADYRSLIDNAEFGKVQINELSRMINREPRLMFSDKKASGKRAALTNTQKALQKGSNISVPTQRYLEKLLNGELKQSQIDENDINQLLANKLFLERPYERISDKGILKDLLKEITELRKKGFKTQKIYKMYEQHFIALANSVMQKNSAISADKVVREGGRPDLTFIYDNSGTIVGVEIKMDTARGVSQTASFKLVNGKFEVSFSNPNPQNTQAEQDLQNKMSERLSQLLNDSEISFDNENQGVSTDDAKTLKLISHMFLKDMRVEITAAYIAAHYNMKGLPETFINIGEAGLFYMLENVVKPEQSKFYENKVKELVSEGISEADAQKQARQKFVETREITLRVAEALNIPELKSNQKLYLGARLIVSEARPKKNNTHRVTGKIEPQIDSKNFDDSTFGNLSNPKNMARFVEALNNDSVKYGSKSSNRNLEKAAMNARLVDKNTKAKGISIWDFDDTLAQTKSNVLFTDPNGKKGKLNAEDFAKKGADLLSKGYVFDFSEFSKVTDGKPGPFFKKAIDRVKKFGNKDNFILTARPADAAGPIKQFLDSLGLDIPLENITGLANSTPQAKALWIVDKVADGYNDIYFADDALANVQVVKDVLGQVNVRSNVQLAKAKYSRRKNTPIFKARMTKARPDLTAKQIGAIVGSVFDFTESDAVPIKKRNKFENLAYNYIENGFVILPEDGYKIIEAERLATIKKIDPMSVNNPNEIIEKYAGTVKEAKTNPDTVKEFSNKKDLGNGVVTYKVEQTKEGQLAVRKVIDTHFGKKSNPWCLAARSNRAEQEYQEFSNKDEADRYADELKERGYEAEVSYFAVKENVDGVEVESDGTYEVYGDLMLEPGDPRALDEAFTSWESYKRGGKGYQVVFTDGKLSHFKDGSGQYWDRMDDNKSYISKKLSDLKLEDGFTQKRELNISTGKEVVLEQTKITGNKQNGVYTETVVDPRDNTTTTNKKEYKDGEQLSHKQTTKKSNGVTTIVVGGVLDIETIYPEGFDNTGVKYTEVGKIMKKASKQTGLDLYIKNPTSIRTFEKPGTRTDVKVVKGAVGGKEITLEVEITTVETQGAPLSSRFQDRTDSIKVNGKTVYTAPKVNLSKSSLRRSKAVQNVLKQFDIKSDVQQAKIKASNRRSVDFNKILERKTGVPFDETFSRARAIKRGRDKNKFQLFVPPSADDFVGLIYYMIGKGRQGEQDFQFLKKNLIDPFARASRELDMARQSLINDWNNVRKKHKDAVKKLGKKIPGMDYTYDDAIRVFLWDLTGQEIPGLSKKEVRELRDVVVKNMGLIKFAMDVKLIVQLKDGYVKPDESWTAGSIASDVQEAVNDIRRGEFLQEWSKNIKELFTEDNLNKLEALFGTTYRQSLEDILYRMEKGKNRPKGTDAATNRFMNWLAGSVGAIMFFNVKSAVLQNISILNYINYTDNNPIQAARAFANQKQYWADFAYIFNSDFLKQRRSGLNTNIESNELASIAANATNKARAILAYLLKIGFTPTQIADSFAISAGGATFYRNRVKRFVSEGMSQAEAEKQAFAEFRETTEESQQSARPDRISKQQASSLGRLLLNFQNYPMQQNRIIKKTVLDMKNGRGDMKQHVSRLLYYGFAQNIIFLSLQNALFAMLFEEAEDDDELLDTKTERIFNGMADTLLRGSGIVGGIIATVKNTVLKAMSEGKKGRNANEANILLEVTNLSPAVGSKLRKIVKGFRSYKWDKDAISEMEIYDSRNPIWSISAPIIEGTTNAPVDRIVRKINNIRLALDSNYSAMARLSMFLGVSPYELGINPMKDVKDARQRSKDKSKGKGNQSTSTKKGEKRCKAATSSGPRCRNMTNNKNGKCYAHQ